jgi:hypothetical protein
MVLLDPPAASTSSAAPASQWIKVISTINLFRYSNHNWWSWGEPEDEPGWLEEEGVPAPASQWSKVIYTIFI